MWCRKKILKKKITEANFSNLVSYLLYAYQKKSTEKLLAKSILWAKVDMRILQRLALNSVVQSVQDLHLQAQDLLVKESSTPCHLKVRQLILLKG